ncbi:MAG: TolC family protein [Candidatus Jettenia sp.]|uniref:Outer membrane efflux protein n=1 Tax=Candidatus Jettenia caeni TaxID=247490 RepID=I3ILL9_9BACT|nr:TolC family protein [Candidatus Jettenia sp. AMX1]MBC6927361.1 TolC family protein [Candidatus Jettenia sp.]WKZ14434.1 MAG: TolC family protein [Candidatus Jettenia caeni]KAA0251738.1 MAG: TolC family protein [Candidatus Jettenia sp. AMX1]MCE7879044.1 TolC family protein [Candidatus Jettenia sp. AMX1]MCQ3925790.1 TolC family protein [Candidatus Jettenia sp.]
MIKKITKDRNPYRKIFFLASTLFLILSYGAFSFGEEDQTTVQIPSAISPENTIEIVANLKSLSLGVRESILYALRNNFDIELSRLNSDLSDYDITIEKARYDPVMALTGTIENNDTPINSQLVGGFGTTAFTPFIQRGRTANAVIQSLIPTGATLALEYNIFRDFVDPNRFRFLNPSVTNFLEARITQPLLKGAGWFYNRSLIYIARNNKKISLAQFKTTAIEVSNSIQEAYWNFVKALEDLKVAQKSLERAEDLLRKNKIQVEAGTLAPIEIIDAEAGVASRVEAVISAENAIKDSEDELKRIMNLENNEIISDATIIPIDEPGFEPKKIELKDAIKTAMERRPELYELQLRVENAGMQTRRRKNELYPQLDFTGGVRYTGLGEDVDDANSSAVSEDFQGEFFGLSLSIPIGNRSARSEYNKSKIEKRQAHMNVKKKELDIVVEVREAVRDVITNRGRVNATRKSRELAQERLESEEKKFSVGRTTSLEVLRAQEDLATAEGNAAKAIVDYEISLGNLEKAKGTILDAYNIMLEEEIM